MERQFTVHGIALKRVEIFPYLGRPVSFVDSDVPAMRRNLKKARGVWSRVSRILRAEYIPPPVYAMFYKAVVMSVLLYGSETWCPPLAEMQTLEGFHVAAARILTGKRPVQKKDGTWRYPKTSEVLEAAHLHTIAQYAQVRRRAIVHKIKNRPVLQMCREAERRRGSAPRKYWVDLDFDDPELADFGGRGTGNDGPREFEEFMAPPAAPRQNVSFVQGETLWAQEP